MAVAGQAQIGQQLFWPDSFTRRRRRGVGGTPAVQGGFARRHSALV